MHWLVLLLTTVVMLATAPDPAPASNHDRARDAVQAGEALPLDAILGQLRGRYPGRMLDAQLNQGGGLTYQIRILGPDGRVVVLTVDAKTGRVLSER